MEKITEINTYWVRKTMISSTFLIRLGFKGTVVNRALPFLHGRSLKITLTVPLIVSDGLQLILCFLLPLVTVSIWTKYTSVIYTHCYIQYFGGFFKGDSALIHVWWVIIILKIVMKNCGLKFDFISRNWKLI